MRVAAKDAVILDALYAGGFGARDSLLVYDSVLEPEIRDAEANDVVDDGRHIFRGTEYVDEVDAGAGLFARGILRRCEVGITRHVEYLGQDRVHG